MQDASQDIEKAYQNDPKNDGQRIPPNGTTPPLDAKRDMNNKSIYLCKECRQEYCIECSENENWKDFCSEEYEEEFKKALQKALE